MGNKALYPYPALYPDQNAGKYNLKTLNFGYDGYVRNETNIWIKTAAGINPNDSVITVSDANRFMVISGNYTNAFLKVKGITFQHFGKPGNVRVEIQPDLSVVVKADKALVFDFGQSTTSYSIVVTLNTTMEIYDLIILAIISR